ncbi:hypothetical protein D3C79_659790 [compost metagenome]
MADRLAVVSQLIDRQHRLVDFGCQPANAALLLLHQRAAIGTFVVDLLRTIGGQCSAARHFLRSGAHLVHRRGDLLDLFTLAAD